MFTKLHSAPKAPLFFCSYPTVVGDLSVVGGWAEKHSKLLIKVKSPELPPPLCAQIKSFPIVSNMANNHLFRNRFFLCVV